MWTKLEKPHENFKSASSTETLEPFMTFTDGCGFLHAVHDDNCVVLFASSPNGYKASPWVPPEVGAAIWGVSDEDPEDLQSDIRDAKKRAENLLQVTSPILRGEMQNDLVFICNTLGYLQTPQPKKQEQGGTVNTSLPPIGVEITLILTEAEWAEVANALLTKIDAVVAGRYNDDVRPGSWLPQLRSAYNKVTKRLTAAGVPF